MLKQLKEFFDRDIWNVRSASLPRGKAFSISFGRIVTLTCRHFVKNKCTLRAASLTFLTLMSVVPVVALILGISRGFSFEEKIREKLLTSFVGQEQVAEWILSFADAALKTASGGIVTGVGVGLLLWTALKLLASIENSFNDIWGIKQGRAWLRKLSDYLTLLLLCPVLAATLIGFSALSMARIEGLVELPGKSYMMSAARYLSPFILAWVSFFFLYLFIPNTRVKAKAAFAGGLFTGTLFIAIQYMYMYLQSVLTGYNAIYGSFAALPFFLVWLQTSWTVILLGAQLSFAVQNVNYYEFYPSDKPISGQYRSLCALRIMRLLGNAFRDHRGGVPASEISSTLEIPIRIARSVLYDLIAANLVVEIAGDRRTDESYLTKIPNEDAIPTEILTQLAGVGDNGYQSELAADAEMTLRSLWNAAAASPANTNLIQSNRSKD